jgi:hypothetical protein
LFWHSMPSLQSFLQASLSWFWILDSGLSPWLTERQATLNLKQKIVHVLLKLWKKKRDKKRALSFMLNIAWHFC